MKMGFVMDPIDGVNVEADTTFDLMLAAQRKGFDVFYIRPEQMSCEDDEAWAPVQAVTVRRDADDKVSYGPITYAALHSLDCLWLRKDPPFDTAYLHEVNMAELAQQKGCLVLNEPRGLRGANEKLYALNFPEAIPATVVTANSERIKEFIDEQGGRAVLKPLNGHGGEGIFVLDSGDRNLNAMIEISTQAGRDPVMCQAYLPAARQGDKRIIMLHGEPLGAILRVPSEKEHRGNIHVGGVVQKTTLTERERQICALVGPRLVADGLHFVGIDVIGDHLTEVNVTSPTGIQEISRLDGIDGAGQVMDWILKRLQ